MRTIGLAAAVIAATLTGCGDDSDGASDELRIDDAWVRSTPAVVDNAAVYMTITSPIDDTLTSVTVDDEVAGRATMHETVTAPPATSAGGGHGSHQSDASDEGHEHGGHDHDRGGMGGVSTMEQLDSIALPAGEPMAFSPGARHIMLEQLVDQLESGDSVQLTLEFEQADPRDVTVDVLDQSPT